MNYPLLNYFKKRNKKNTMKYWAHKTTEVSQGAKIGKGTKIWHNSQVQSGAKIGKNCIIGHNCFIGSRAILGNGVKLESNIDVWALINLEDNVFIGPSAVLTNDPNPRSSFPKHGQWVPTLVKKGASIGANATIVCGITIGECAFIGAGTVVIRDVPDYAIVVGNPARIIGWMCECGKKLEFKMKKTACKCGRGYKKTNDIVEQD